MEKNIKIERRKDIYTKQKSIVLIPLYLNVIFEPGFTSLGLHCCYFFCFLIHSLYWIDVMKQCHYIIVERGFCYFLFVINNRKQVFPNKRPLKYHWVRNWEEKRCIPNKKCVQNEISKKWKKERLVNRNSFKLPIICGCFWFLLTRYVTEFLFQAGYVYSPVLTQPIRLYFSFDSSFQQRFLCFVNSFIFLHYFTNGQVLHICTNLSCTLKMWWLQWFDKFVTFLFMCEYKRIKKGMQRIDCWIK